MPRLMQRRFGGKVYDFFMFKDTKAEAKKVIKPWKERQRKMFGKDVLMRITTEKHPRTGKKRYVIWTTG